MTQQIEGRPWSYLKVIGAWWLWVSICVASAVAGARIATWQYPLAPHTTASFSEYSELVLNFVMLASGPSALCQGLILCVFFKPKRRGILRMLLWIPITFAGLVTMYLSIWSTDYVALNWGALFLFVLFPGAIMMGFLQSTFVLSAFNFSAKVWIIWSALSPIFGEVLYFTLLEYLPEGSPRSHDAMLFAGCLGLAFGVWQATVLASHFSRTSFSDGRREVLQRRFLDRWE